MSDHSWHHFGQNRSNWSNNMRAIRRARLGKFRVVGEDRKYYGDDYVIAEYDTIAEAIECTGAHSEPDHPHFVYDDQKSVVYNPEGLTPFRYDRYSGGPYIDKI